jgi:hypothetical protein
MVAVRHAVTTDCGKLKKSQHWEGLQMHYINSRFRENRSLGPKVDRGETLHGCKLSQFFS